MYPPDGNPTHEGDKTREREVHNQQSRVPGGPLERLLFPSLYSKEKLYLYFTQKSKESAPNL